MTIETTLPVFTTIVPAAYYLSTCKYGRICINNCFCICIYVFFSHVYGTLPLVNGMLCQTHPVQL